MPKQEKLDAVAEYGKLFKESGSFFVTDYQGLSVADLTVLRKSLRDSNVTFLVGKNTLFKIAAKEAQVDGIDEHLAGPTAIAFTADEPAVAAKILHDSYKAHELPLMKAFWVDDVAYTGDQIKRLADLPPIDTLYSMVVSAVEAPLTELVGSIDGFFRKLVGTVDALAEQKKGEE
jgi:large subunit ribosomal protein L10